MRRRHRGLGAWSGRVLLAACVAGCMFASIARADGDPASDYLLAGQVFLSSTPASESLSQRQLIGVVRAANADGFAIRVALISSQYDLGSITALWDKPRLYARFLGQELSLAYKGRLLVAMPDGFGFYWPGHPTGAAYRVLARTATGSSVAAALAAVRGLAAADRVTLAPSSAPPGRTPAADASSSGGVWVLAGGLAALAAVLLLLFALSRRRGFTRKRRRGLAPPSESSVSRLSPTRIRPRWAVPGFGILCVLALGTPILALSLQRGGAASTTPAGSVITPPPFKWPAGRRPAPEFVLRDQHGREVSVGAYRGRTVIVTFVDPLCRNLCPLEAHLLNAVVDRMPARQRPEILAVSVDVYGGANARVNLVRDVHHWGLVPQWHWAVGRPRQLAAVWKRYEIGVAVTTRRVAATTIHYITHTEGAYIIDASGHERALFLWPFYPQDVEHVLRAL